MAASATLRRNKRIILVSVLIVAGIAAILSAAHGIASETYPTKPIRLVAPFPAGGVSDILARLLAEKLTGELGQNLWVDNRGGGGGVIGCAYVAKASPDGYTLLLGGSGNLSISPQLYIQPPYTPLVDFQPLSLIGAGPRILVVHPSMPARSVKQLLALAKARPGQLNFASGGTGDGNHLASELFTTSAHVRMVHVPYRGTGPALTELIGGQVHMMISSPLPAMPFVRVGKLRVLGVTSLNRTPLLPDVPTISESGLDGFESTSWFGMLVPIKTPKTISATLENVLVKLMNRPDLKERLAGIGIDASGSSSEQFASYISMESRKMADLIKLLGLKVQ